MSKKTTREQITSNVIRDQITNAAQDFNTGALLQIAQHAEAILGGLSHHLDHHHYLQAERDDIIAFADLAYQCRRMIRIASGQVRDTHNWQGAWRKG